MGSEACPPPRGASWVGVSLKTRLDPSGAAGLWRLRKEGRERDCASQKIITGSLFRSEGDFSFNHRTRPGPARLRAARSGRGAVVVCVLDKLAAAGCLRSEQPLQCWRETLYVPDSAVLAILEGDFSVTHRLGSARLRAAISLDAVDQPGCCRCVCVRAWAQSSRLSVGGRLCIYWTLPFWQSFCSNRRETFQSIRATLP